MSMSHLYGTDGEDGVEMESFEVSDWDLQNEFNPHRQRHRQTKEEATYGVWAERDSDEERPSFGGKRCGRRRGKGRVLGTCRHLPARLTRLSRRGGLGRRPCAAGVCGLSTRSHLGQECPRQRCLGGALPAACRGGEMVNSR